MQAPAAGGLQHPGRVQTGRLGDHAPLLREPLPRRVQRDPPGEHTGGQSHVEGAVDVRPPQGGQEPHAGKARQHGGRCRDRLARLGERRPAQNDDDVALAEQPAHLGYLPVDQAPGGAGRVPAHVRDRGPGVAAEAGPPGCQLDQRNAPVDRRCPQPEVEDGQLFLQVGRQQDHCPRPAGVVDRGPGQPEHHVGR